MEQATISSDLIRGHLDTIILHSLKESDKHAQQISDFVELKSESQYKINQASLYSSLKRLESLKYVTAYWNESSVGRRKYFKITEFGKDFVDKNLSSWSFSRGIIDKLMDIQPEHKVVYNYAPLDGAKPQNEPVIQSNTEKPVEPNTVIFTNKNNQNLTENQSEKPQNDPQQTQNYDVNPLNNSASKNFRHILNGLILNNLPNQASSTQENIVHNDEILDVPHVVNDDDIKPIPILEDFNRALSDENTDYSSHKVSNNGKIDYGDLMVKASKEGYKIRISSRDSALSLGNILINKLNFANVFALYILMLLEFGAIILSTKNIISTPTIISTVLVLTLFVLLFLIRLVKNPEKKSSKDFYPDRIFTSAIIAFNLALITLACNFIFNVDFSNVKLLVICLITPLLVIFNAVIYFIIEYFNSKQKTFNAK